MLVDGKFRTHKIHMMYSAAVDCLVTKHDGHKTLTSLVSNLKPVNGREIHWGLLYKPKLPLAQEVSAPQILTCPLTSTFGHCQKQEN